MDGPLISDGKLNLSDDQLIERIRKGEHRLFQVLFDRHVSRVVCYAAMLTQCREDAQDVAQETFIKVFHALGTYQPRGKFLSWVCTIARRIVIDQKRKLRIPVTNLEAIPEPCRPASLSEPVSDIDPLAGLSLRDREILTLRFVMELPYQEIAVITELSEGSLRNIVCRNLQRLKEDVLEHGL